MAIITLENDFQFNLDKSSEIVGDQPYKKETKLDTIGTWKLVEKLDGLKEFTFSVKNDEHEKANILVERNISVPFLTPFNGIITGKKPGRSQVDFTAVEDAWHFTRKKFKCHDKRRIKFTQEEWYNKLWRFRRKITIQGKKFHDLSTGSDLLNFPLLFHTIDPELKTHARSDGYDILFTKTENDETVIKLHHEIEEYIPSTGELWVWIEYPEIRSGQDEEFEMYFGNENSIDQQDPSGTWDDYLGGFGMVQHLHNDSLDSTSNNNDGTDTSIAYVNGKIANSAKFDGDNSKIDCGSGASIDDIFGASGGGWITAWFNANSDGEADVARILDKSGNSSGATNGWTLQVELESGGLLGIQFAHGNSTTRGRWNTSADIPINSNIRVDVFYDNNADTNDPLIWINGVLRSVPLGTITELQTPVGTGLSDAAHNLIIGNWANQTKTFDGTIEEVRILKSPPTNISELIKIEYANELNPTDYFVVGQAEEYIQQADIIADTIIRSANRDMPILNTTSIPGLISLWRLDGDALDSKGSNDGTWTGNELYVKGYFNTEASEKCAKFDGSSYISTSDNDFDFDKTTPFSISFWYKADTGLPAGNENVFAKGTGINATGFSAWRWSGGGTGEIQFTISDGTNIWQISPTPPTIGEWELFTFTFSGNSNRNGMKAYKNGILENTGGSATTMNSTLNNDNLTIGAGSAGASKLADGKIDDFRVYNRELTAKEVSRLYKMTQSDLDIVQTKVQWKLGDGHVTTIPDLVSLWKFDQSLLDVKTNNNWNPVGDVEYADGVYNTKGFKGNGTTYLTQPTPSTMKPQRTDEFTISFWHKPLDIGATRMVWGNLNPADSAGVQVFLSSSDIYRIRHGVDGTNYAIVDGPVRTDFTKPILITITKSATDGTGASYKWYYDGVLQTPTVINDTYTTGTIDYTGHTLTCASQPGGANIDPNSIIDDLRYYSRELTELEVKRLYEATDSGIDRIRDDNISTRLLEIDFIHKDHLESLRKIAKELAVNIFFDSQSHRVFIKNKGKPIAPIFDKSEISSPEFTLKNVSNVVNVVGAEKDGIQKEKSFENTNSLKYNYEETFTDGSISTDETLDLIGTNIVDQLDDLQPDLTITTSNDQYNRFDIQTGDTLNISELRQDLQGIFRIISISLTETKVTLGLTKHTRSAVQTAGRDIGSLISGIIGKIQDLSIKPE